MSKQKHRIEVKRNKQGRIVIKMDHSSMQDFCQGLSAVVDMQIIREDRCLNSSQDVNRIVYELMLLDLYNRLMNQVDSPLRGIYSKSEKYTVKLSPAEAVVYWATINPVEIIHHARPAIRIILDNIYKLMA